MNICCRSACNNNSTASNDIAIFTRKKMKANLIETFKILNGIANYGWNFFSISLWIVNLLSKQISKTESSNQLDFFC